MRTDQARQIADLLNTRNQLSRQYSADRVRASQDEYVLESEGDSVIACVQVKKVQWYQCEILHLSVRHDHEGRGWGKQMLARAEDKARKEGARLAQCTIRIGNDRSESLFRNCGYHETSRFANAISRNEVAVWQKVL